jgi:hypothetical protein
MLPAITLIKTLRLTGLINGSNVIARSRIADLVAWYSFGVHHIPRPEDWPVMPVAYAGFMLKPAGFFEQNPAMDVAPPRPRHQCCDEPSKTI